MSEHVSAMDARKRFGRLLDIVSITGEEIIIERSGKKIAKLAPCDAPGRRSSGRLDFRKAKGLGKALWRSVDTEAYMEQERSQWD